MARTLGAKNKKHKRRSKKLLVAKNMPPLYHTLPGQDFAREKSQVLKWLADAPEIQDWVMEQLKSAGYIDYNPDTGQWFGVDYGA
ncbi:TPA: hypothetical protein ACGO3H_000215 [Streptococcus suis]